MRIILDITRLLLRRHNPTPTGIDRVEFAYLARLLDNRAFPDVHFVVSTHGCCGTVARRLAQRLFEETSRRWTVNHAGNFRPQFDALVGHLQQPIDPSRSRSARYGNTFPDSWSAKEHVKLIPTALRGYASLWQLLLAARTVPTCYLHVSHMCLEHPHIFRWLHWGHVRPIFFIHDLIPIDHPEYCGDDAHDRHARRIATAARLGNAIVVNSQYTAERLRHFARTSGRTMPPVVASALGTELPVSQSSRDLQVTVPYFVHIGTIEARKNVHQLLTVWRSMLARQGPERMPRLLLAGRRGWKNQNVFDLLDGCREIAPYVSEASNLNDTELDLLVRNSAALLAPSLVEGFGLAGVEALARGVPVIASDIPAHREVLGDAALLIDPADGIAWARAINSLAWDNGFRRGRQDAARLFVPTSWTQHVDAALSGAFGHIRTRYV